MFNGDMTPIWDAYSFSDEDRRYDAEFNDIPALGAMSMGENRSGVAIDLRAVAAPALVIAGGHGGTEEADRTAAAIGVEPQILSDLDHLESFSRLDLVMPLVMGFLDRHGI